MEEVRIELVLSERLQFEQLERRKQKGVVDSKKINQDVEMGRGGLHLFLLIITT